MPKSGYATRVAWDEKYWMLLAGLCDLVLPRMKLIVSYTMLAWSAIAILRL